MRAFSASMLPGRWCVTIVAGDTGWDGEVSVSAEQSTDVTFLIDVRLEVGVLSSPAGRTRILDFVRELRGDRVSRALSGLLPDGPCASPRTVGGGASLLMVTDAELQMRLGGLSRIDVENVLEAFNGRRKKPDPPESMEIHAT